MTTQIQLRRGSASAWTTANSTLAAGEVGVETDTGKFKIGDGATSWNSLAYSINKQLGPVGADGTTLVANSSASTGVSWATPVGSLANPVINGGMDNWQRGVSVGASNGNAYTADRWQLSTGGGMSCTVSRQATGDTTNLPNIQYCARVQRNSGQTATGGWGFNTSFETVNSIPFAGKTVTISFYARAGSNYSGSSYGLELDYGTGTDQNIQSGFTGAGLVASVSIASPSTTWQRFVATGTVPTNATQLGIYLHLTAAGTALTNDYVEITGVQIDLGTYTATTAPAFRRSGGTLQGELSACMRYFQYFNNPTYAFSDFGFNGGVGISSTAIVAQKTLAVPMRAVPVVASFSNVSWVAYWGLGVTNITNVTAYSASSTQVASLQFTTTGVSAGTAYPIILQNNSTSAFISISAEL